VGGGITGLVAAWCLSSSSFQQRTRRQHVTLFEAGPTLGGRIVTRQADGLLIEGGPDGFLAQKAEGLQLCRALGLEPNLVFQSPNGRHAFVSRGKHLFPISFGLLGASSWAGILRNTVLSPTGRIRVLLEPLVRAAPNGEGEDESVAEFAIRRFGTEAYQRVLEPLLCGIHAGDGMSLSAQAVLPQWRLLERDFGSVSRGMRAQSVGTTSARGFVSLRGGMGQLVDGLAAAIPDAHVRTGSEVREINRDAGGFVVRQGEDVLAFDAVILAAPAYVAAHLVSALDPDLANVLREITFVSTATVSLVYDRSDVPHDLLGSGYVVPETEGRAALGCTWSSSKWVGRSPADRVLVRVYLGRAGRDVDALSVAELVTLAREEVQYTLGVTGPALQAFTFRFPDAMPQYTIGHLERLRRIDESVAQHPGLALAGCSYRGVGIPDCIASARHAAASVTEFLARESTS